MGVFDVPTNMLLEAIALDLKKEQKVSQPSFALFVKTGAHKERAPQNEDWYFYRCASVLYRVFKDGPIGTGSLRTYYGGRKSRGVKPHRHRKASGKIIRLALQQLEKTNYIRKNKQGGRVITPQGQKYLNEISKIAAEMSKNYVKKKRVFKRTTKSESEVSKMLRGKGKTDEKGKGKKKEGEEGVEK